VLQKRDSRWKTKKPWAKDARDCGLLYLGETEETEEIAERPRGHRGLCEQEYAA
jgi:hypothetical protein